MVLCGLSIMITRNGLKRTSAILERGETMPLEELTRDEEGEYAGFRG